MRFVAVDVETANADLASICQIGIVHFNDGEIVERWESLIDPEDFFDLMNIAVHGIDETAVDGKPTFPQLSLQISEKLIDTVVVCHTTFDQSAIRAVFSKYGITLPSITWLDTARVVRRTWTDLSRSGYGLAPVAERLGIKFQHHNAVEDARAAGEILLHAMRETKLSIDDWIICAKRPIGTPLSGGTSEAITRSGNPEGPLFGEVVAFTGALSIPRRDAADIAALAGCEVGASVTIATTLLVVGDQDVQKLAGHEKSSKHRKAEKLIEKGQAIRILRETDFLSIVKMVEQPA